MNTSVIMADDTILSRISKLNQQIVGKCCADNVLISREGLLDAIFVLYNECNNEHLMRNKYIGDFVTKYTPLVNELRRVRISLEDFEIQSIIGRGHFGQVEVVREKQTGDVFAMKTLRKFDTLAQENAAFYEEERDIMAKASSPWITHLQYAFQDGEMLYLVMEFHPGGDLLSLLGRYDDMLDERMASFYLAEMVLAINSLHTMGYVHRDIKPENVLIDRTGHIKLADFGSAAKLNESKMVTSKMPVGTPDYVSPELLIAMNSSTGLGSYSVEVDWWSLGIVAYEMLYGVTPFADDSNSMVATYSNIMNYRKSLVFQPAIPVSSEAKSFIKSLLTGVTDRMGFEELKLHKFFENIDFDTVRLSKPPFIPTISSLDDTSNFEAFEREKPPQIPDDFASKTEFSGCDLPFVGFTYAKTPSGPGLDRSILPDIFSPVKTSNAEQKLQSKSKELQCLREKCHNLEEQNTQLDRENTRMKNDTKSYTEKLAKLTAERDILERDMTSYIAQVSSLKRQLDLEVTEREGVDDRAMQLLDNIREQQRVADKLREENHRDEMEEYMMKISQLEEENAELLKKLKAAEDSLESRGEELKAVKSKVQQLSGRVDKIKTDRRTSCVALKVELAQDQEHHQVVVKDMQDKIDKLTVKNVDLTNLFRDTRKDKARLEQEVKQLKNGEAKEELNELKKRLAEFEDLQKTHDDKLEKLKAAEANLSQLQAELEGKVDRLREATAKIADLEEKLRAIEASQKRSERMSSHKTDQLEETVAEMKSELKRLEAEKGKLESTYRELYEKKETEKIDKIKKELENQLKSAEESCRQQEKMASDKTGKLEETVKELKGELQKLQNEKDKLNQSARDVYEKKEREREDCMKVKVEECEKKVKEAREKQQVVELSLMEEKEKTANLLAKLETEKKAASETIGALEKSKLETLKQLTDLKQSCSVINDLEKDIEELAEKYNTALQEKKEVEAKYEQAMVDTTDEKDIQILVDSLADKKRLVEHQEQKLNRYKSVIDEMEEQIEDLEKLVEVYQDKEKQWFQAKKEFEKAAHTIDSHVDVTNKKLQAEKETKALLNKKVQELTKTLEKERATSVEEKEGLKGKVKELTTKLSMFSDQLSQMEREKGLSELSLKNVQRQLETEANGGDVLKEEVSKWRTQTQALKDTNFKLSQGLEEALDKCESFKAEKQDLEATIENLQMVYQNEKYKLESTLSQQTKLIDYLQAKGETPAPKKKKTLFSLPTRHHVDVHLPAFKGLQNTIFGTPAKPSKEPPETPRGQSAHSYKDLQHLLEMERARTKRMHDQVTDLRTELHKAKTDSIKLLGGSQISLALRTSTENLTSNSSCYTEQSNIVPTRSLPSSPTRRLVMSERPLPLLTPRDPSKTLQRAPSSAAPTEVYTPSIPRIKKSRIQHDIPHKFITGVNTRATKCAVCLGPVSFVKTASKCQECNLVCHPKCASQAPATCGLPTEYMTHFTEMMNRKAMSPAVNVTSVDTTGTNLAGWMKVPRSSKQSWDRRYVKLDDTVLYIFDREDCHRKLVDEFDLCALDGEVTVHSGVTASELGNTSPSDLPFIMRLDSRPFTSCWPGRTLYLMAPSFSDKQKWVAVLESITGYSQSLDSQKQAKLLGNMLMCVESAGKLDLNCSLLLSDKLLILGAEEGLYAVELLNKNSTPLPLDVDGVAGVYQMELIKDIDTIILITGKDRRLVKIGVSALLTHIHTGLRSTFNRSSVSVSSVEKIGGCTVFTTANVANNPYIVAAGPQRVVILKYNDCEAEFDIRKEILTAESCSCLHITSEFAIIGTDKFHQLNLHTYEVTEFLDKTDSSLAFALFGAAQFNSFPIAVLRVTDTPREFLLCFHEFGIFVDSNGKRSRDEDLKWAGLPLAFALREPYLFVTHFNALQVIEIPPMNTAPSHGSQTTVSVMNPRYLGPALSEGAVYVASVQSDCVEVMCFKGNFAQTDKENPCPVSSLQRGRSAVKTGQKRGFVSPERSPMKLRSFQESPYSSKAPTSPVSLFPRRAVNKKVRYSDSETETDV